MYHARHSMLQDALLRRKNTSRKQIIPILDNASIQVKKGEWVGLYGPNGSGKTTLMRILGGLMQPDTGTVQASGKMSLFLGLGVGFEKELSAEKNIYYHSILYGLSRQEIRKVTASIIEFAGLEKYQHLPIKHYSSGMQMRLAYAAAAQVDADIYLFDEVLAVGDEEFQKRCRQHLAKLKQAGKTIMLVSHSKMALSEHCDRVLTINDKKITPFNLGRAKRCENI